MTAVRTTAACLVAAVAAACASPSSQGGGVTIDRLVALSDGDHAASTYVDGILAPVEAGHRDRLTTLSVRNGAVTSAGLEVSNSVTAAPEVLALSPDGTTAFVAERLGQRRPDDSRADQLPAGDRLFAVDISDLDSPAVAADVAVAQSPEALAVHPDGTYIAVVSNTPDSSYLQLVPWTGPGFGSPERIDLAGLGVTSHAQGPRDGVTATNVQWHPSGRALAVNITTQNRVVFFMFDSSPNGGLSVRRWGDPVMTGVDPFVGRFTPDGRHYLTSDWGRNLATTDINQRLPGTRSKLSVIAVGDPGAATPRVVGSAESDTNAEGLAISPDGRLVATVNMRGTALPADSPKFDEEASVSLLSLDSTTGGLSKVGDYPLDGVLPEGGTFDPSGRFFIASVFEGRSDSQGGPGLQIYRVGTENSPGLTPVQRISLPHGVHHVVAG